MRYLPTTDLSNCLMALRLGRFRLQRGQWVTVDGSLGRYIGVSAAGVIWIDWPRKRAGFQRRCTAFRALDGGAA